MYLAEQPHGNDPDQFRDGRRNRYRERGTAWISDRKSPVDGNIVERARSGDATDATASKRAEAAEWQGRRRRRRRRQPAGGGGAAGRQRDSCFRSILFLPSIHIY